MAWTPEQIAAAKKEGYSDAEIAEHAAASQAANPNPAGTASIAAPGSEYDPSAGGGQLSIGPWDTGVSTPQWLDRLMAGTGRGMEHTVKSVGNLLGAYSDKDMKNDAPLMATGAGKAGNILGETAISAPLGMGVGAGAARLAPVALRAGGLANAGIQGATQGLATSDPGDRTINTVLGGVAGTALPAALGLGKTAIRGLTRTDAAQRLIDSGIDLTPGQMNPTGMFNMLEQAGDSVPGVKQIVHPARENAEAQMHAHIIQQGAAPGAAPIKPSENISDMLQQAYDSYKPLYDQAKGYPVTPSIVRTSGPDIPLSASFKVASKTPGTPKSIQDQENAWLQDRLTQLPKNPDSEHLLDLRSDIRQRAREAALRTDNDSAHVANINQRAQGSITSALESQLPQQPLDALKSADSQYGTYKVIEDAVAKSKDNLAGLSPQKLSAAIYNATPDGAYARGAGGPLRQLAKDGTEVFQNVIPPTGARTAMFGMGAGGLLGAPHVAIPVGTAGLMTVGSKTGRALAQGVTKPQRIAQMLQDKFNSAVPDVYQNAGRDLAQPAVTQAAMPYVAPTGQAVSALLAHKWKTADDKDAPEKYR